MRKMLFVVNDANYFLSHRVRLALALLKSGWVVSVAVPAGSDGRDHELIRYGFSVYHYKFYRGGLNPFKEVLTIISLFFLYRSVSPDVVHHLTVKPVLYGGIAARLAGVKKRIFAFLGLGYLFYSPERRAGLLRLLLAPFFRASLGGVGSFFIFQNPDDYEEMKSKKLLSGKSSDRVHIILGSGVDLREYQGTEEVSPEVVLFAGRLTRAKGIEDFSAAAGIVRKKGYICRFVVCGDIDQSNPEAIPESAMTSWVSEGCIEWLGHRSDIKEIVASSAIVSLPSRYGEGVPKILIEAAASSRAIVTTDTPGCREIVHDGVNGFLVPVGNPHALADAIVKLLKSPDMRQAMGEKGRVLVEKEFSIDVVIEKTLALYND